MFNLYIKMIHIFKIDFKNLYVIFCMVSLFLKANLLSFFIYGLENIFTLKH